MSDDGFCTMHPAVDRALCGCPKTSDAGGAYAGSPRPVSQRGAAGELTPPPASELTE